ncbi:hypothetical protein [Gordonia rhizosphera]|uniref:hypothetical protein n=1 Tax=Gordonia rhizosphera TaxID=83341 RepID=UPI001FE0CAAA|nr:hypothetical protein [Gordonia rhizosphera]
MRLRFIMVVSMMSGIHELGVTAAMRTRFEFDLHTTATPEQVVEVLTDFSSNRPKRWPALSAKLYRVHRVGDTDADVQEGQDFPKFYAIWHYDWSTPGTVTMTVTDSDYAASGGIHSIVATAGHDGGSDVHGIWDITAKNTSANIGVAVMRVAGARFFRVYYRRVLDGVATGTR